MKKNIKKTFSIAFSALSLFAGAASATPSTHIWAPSTDVQAYGVFHLTHDVYVAAKEDKVNQQRPQTITNEGLTVGVLPYEKLNMEVGFDFINGYGNELDKSPVYFNAKFGVPEDALVKGIPAIAVGAYAIGTNTGGEARAGQTAKIGTDANIYYGKVGKTVGPVGRLSIGYYQGNEKLLVDENSKSANNGILVCWERTISEISDNLWLAVDYQGGNSSAGALSYGFSWKFAPNTSVIFGYVKPNNDKLPGLADSYTVQLDIDFDVFSKKK